MKQKEPTSMNARLLSIIAASGLLIATTSVGHAQSRSQENAPGQRMQDRGSVPAQPGAAADVPGQRMQEKGAGEPGASGFTPGQQSLDTTGRGGAGQCGVGDSAGGSMGDRDPDRDRGDAR
jgi:hypothetical protein